MEDLSARMEEAQVVVDEAKKRCKIASDQIQALPLTKLTDSCKQTLLRLINSELKFLTSISSTPSPSPINPNIGYIECILHILQQPIVSKVSRVCKPSNGVYIDIVCTLNKAPVWVVVSDRNPKYISWSQDGKINKGLKFRIENVLEAAKSGLMLKPASVLLFFANGVDGFVRQRVKSEFGGSDFLGFDFMEEAEDDWVDVIGRSYVRAQTFQIMVDEVEHLGYKLGNGDTILNMEEDARLELFNDETRVNLGEKFCSLVLSMKRDVKSGIKPDVLLGEDGLNFDTTALIALVSGISNDGSSRLLATPESELRKRFKINYEFVIAQVMSERQNPILEELTCVILGKIGMVCESVHLEFREIVSMCGGPKEKLRADLLLRFLLIVPDSPSARMMDILTTRKISLKNKIVFGTGDRWLAPTLTANMGFVRAISQTGMSLLTLEHRPRALIGD